MPLLFCLLPAAAEEPSAAVIVNAGAQADQDSISDMSKTLGTAPVHSPNKSAFIGQVQQKDILYIDSHIYSAKYHLADRVQGRRGGLVVGDSAWVGRSSDDIVTADDVKKALKKSGRSPKLVVLAGCEGAEYGWDKAFGDATVISFRVAVIGYAADIYFKHFFQAWKQSKDVSKALASADASAPQDPKITHPDDPKVGLILRNAMRTIKDPKQRVVSVPGSQNQPAYNADRSKEGFNRSQTAK
jgi:hypothetical protein